MPPPNLSLAALWIPSFILHIPCAFLQSQLPKHKNHIFTETSSFTLSKFKWTLNVARQCSQSFAFYFFAPKRSCKSSSFSVITLHCHLQLHRPLPHHTGCRSHLPSSLTALTLAYPASLHPAFKKSNPAILSGVVSSIVSSQKPGKEGTVREY